MHQRIVLHIAFWIAYTMVYAIINTSFSDILSPFEYTSKERFFIFWAAELWMIPVKMIAAYGFLYFLIPRYLKPGQYFQLLLRCLIWLAPLVVLYRLIVFYQVYPLLYEEYPNVWLASSDRIFSSILDIISAVAVASTVKLLRGRIRSQVREEELKKEKLQSELNFLRAQTNPHFLFNTLNNIYALARKQSANTAPVVLKLSQIMRFMLYECTSPRIAVEDEVRVIRDYIELEKIRYNDRLSILFSENIDQPKQAIAPLLLLPFVENAFKHGISETRFDPFIKIELSLQKGKLEAMIQNSKGENTEDTPSKGIGLKNVRRQLELIYPNSHDLRIENEEQLFTVFLKIDLNSSL